MFSEFHRDVEPLVLNYADTSKSFDPINARTGSASVNEIPTRELLQNPQSETYTFKGLNHLFQTAKKGIGPEEYWEIETTIDERVIEKNDLWIQSIL